MVHPEPEDATPPAAGPSEPGSSLEELSERFMTLVTGPDPFAATDVGLDVVDRFGTDVAPPNVLATLASLLVNRNRPGDCERAVQCSRAVLADLPPHMARSRHNMQYDLAMALARMARPDAIEEALDVVGAMAAGGEAAKEMRIEVLECVHNTLRSPGVIQRPDDAESAVVKEKTCRALVDLDPGRARNNWNLGAVLCSAGKLEEGLPLYEKALELADEPERQGGLNAEDRGKLVKDIETAKKQLSGELPRDGTIIR